ncbi:MAG: carboxypeptidase regulatory-like domain-containing protein, partial [Planctomycetaceae bacterium]|nr:carboxypeptidase regulatory-like domain-containing protein [Planctomycetaceae bacterium]
DEERVAVVTEQAREAGIDPEQPKFAAVRLIGKFEFAPEVTPTEGIHAHVIERQSNASSHITKGPFAETFDLTLNVGIGYVWFNHHDLTPVLIGPFTAADGPEVRDIVVRFVPGLDVPITVIDENGAPAANVKVTASALVDGSGTGICGGTTDEQGRFTLTNIPERGEIGISLSGPGYQAVRHTATQLQPDGEYTYSVSRARPMSGIVVNEAGEPVPDAQVKILYEQVVQFGRVTSSMHHGATNPVAVTTDADGRFELTQLEDNKHYCLSVEHPDYAMGAVAGVVPGAHGVQAVLPPPLTVQGMVDNLELLGEKRLFTWYQVFELPVGDHGDVRDVRALAGQSKVEIADDGSFTIPQVAAGKLEIWFPKSTWTNREFVTVTGDRQPLRLSPPGAPEPARSREVTLTFTHQGQLVRPEGAVLLNGKVVTDAEEKHGRHVLSLDEGRLRFRTRTGERHALNNLDASGMVGFWFSEQDVDFPDFVEWAEEPLEVTIPCYPAGGVTGIVVDDSGKPQPNVGISYKTKLRVPKEQSPGGQDKVYFINEPGNLKTDAQGRYFATPLPLGTEIQFAAVRNFFVDIAPQEIQLTAAEPAAQLRLELGPRVDLQLKVVDEQGRPVPGMPVDLNFKHPAHSHGWSPAPATDATGVVTFRDCNRRLVEHYIASVAPQQNYLPVRVPLRADRTPVLQLERGQILTGTVLDEQGLPVPGMEVYAHVSPRSAEYAVYYDAEQVTDAEGKFRFSNLPTGPLEIGARGFKGLVEVSAVGGQTEPITIQGEVFENFRSR